MINILARIISLIRHYIKLALHELLMRIMFSIHFIKLKWRRRSLKKFNPNRKIIAIDLTEHFGDIVACEPVSRFIRRQNPKAYILWSVRKPYRELIDNNPHIDETLVIYCLTEWILLSKYNFFDQIIELHINGRVCPVCKVPLINSREANISLDNYYNFGSILSTFCQIAGLPMLDDQPAVYISQRAIKVIDSINLPNKYIVVHCASNEHDRDWTASKWQDLVKNLIETNNLTIVEVGTKSTLDITNFDNFINLCGHLSLLETAEVIKRSRLFIGVDSGPAQLANAVMTYGIILIGHYRSFKKYMPYSGGYSAGTNATILYEDGPTANIAVNRVYKEVVKHIDNSKYHFKQR